MIVAILWPQRVKKKTIILMRSNKFHTKFLIKINLKSYSLHLLPTLINDQTNRLTILYQFSSRSKERQFRCEQLFLLKSKSVSEIMGSVSKKWIKYSSFKYPFGMSSHFRWKMCWAAKVWFCFVLFHRYQQAFYLLFFRFSLLPFGDVLCDGL